MVFTKISVKNNHFSAMSTKNIVKSAYSIISQVCDTISIRNISRVSMRRINLKRMVFYVIGQR